MCSIVNDALTANGTRVLNFVSRCTRKTDFVIRGETCYRMVSLLKGSCPKNFVKRYFRELWFLSCGEKEDEYFLTDDHVPAFRAVVQLTAEEKIALGNVQRLTSENESEVQ
ncbi:uncharacterized protein TNIN_371241 [Trichonephila inaurata madagascariensis]|uniref:Uncharacterized protein n=1 Tax=Trichonephila inaurata madagascariensis TaxID=2747483 RepID=A0A8X6IZZ0_9ARAC|nr:uncharacterized protein TNIN_371241 [Trichonephila inaurata madagascariensis]